MVIAGGWGTGELKSHCRVGTLSLEFQFLQLFPRVLEVDDVKAIVITERRFHDVKLLPELFYAQWH